MSFPSGVRPRVRLQGEHPHVLAPADAQADGAAAAGEAAQVPRNRKLGKLEKLFYQHRAGDAQPQAGDGGVLRLAEDAVEKVTGIHSFSALVVILASKVVLTSPSFSIFSSESFPLLE